MLKESICSACGKPHYRYPGNIYKVQTKKKTYIFCGYGCYNTAKKLLESKDTDAFNKFVHIGG